MLLHSVTSLQYKVAGLDGRSVPHLVFNAHYPYLYSTNLSTLIGLRILTLYSSFDVTIHYNLTPFTLPLVKTIPHAPLSITRDGSSHVLSHKAEHSGPKLSILRFKLEHPQVQS